MLILCNFPCFDTDIQYGLEIAQTSGINLISLVTIIVAGFVRIKLFSEPVNDNNKDRLKCWQSRWLVPCATCVQFSPCFSFFTIYFLFNLRNLHILYYFETEQRVSSLPFAKQNSYRYDFHKENSTWFQIEISHPEL